MHIYHNFRCKVKRNVLSFFLKSSKLFIDLISSGKPFQSLGAAAQNALSPQIGRKIRIPLPGSEKHSFY